ncbi:hypothetical protein BD311DRAFT_668806 [Dichomitus squalens]|uniref:Fungal-type protein kinase domain-containing protein n=1 Tax=Dichomitus squalens TaxID=114155 RepID=A0A4V2JZP2_9APHY|nr:hypothetical protein BD311DRAFT_668806 [Dichomitus squalens]
MTTNIQFQARGLTSSLATVGWTSFAARCTHRLPDPTASGPRHRSGTNTFCPDLGIYPVDCPAHSQAKAGDRFRVSWPYIEVVVEVKKSPSSTTRTTVDASTSSQAVDTSTSNQAADASTSNQAVDASTSNQASSRPLPLLSDRGQLIDYGIEVLNRQQRLFCFAIVILDDTARLLRYDRTGITMTSKFDYLERPEVIGRFFYRLSRATRMERGYDPTVVPSSAEEDKLFRGLSARFAPGSTEAQALVNAASAGWPVHKITINAPFSDGEKAVSRHDATLERHFLVGKPAFMGRSLVGRGTKAFVAYDMVNDRVVFIKDSWRPDTRGTESEYEIYLRLRESITTGHLFIPTLLGGGDVMFEGSRQKTCTPATRYVPRIHQRLVLLEVCRPLEDFKDSLELTLMIYAAFTAHQRAWEEAHILHGDVSAGNILIYDSADGPVGLLADWDLAKTQEALEKYPVTQQGRSGTWPFMSACSQQFPDRPHTLADDLESFVHVLNWCLLKYIPNDRYTSHRGVARYIASVYDSADDPEKGSSEKYFKIRNGELFVDLQADHPLNPLLRGLAELCRDHYYHLSLPPLKVNNVTTKLPIPVHRLKAAELVLSVGKSSPLASHFSPGLLSTRTPASDPQRDPPDLLKSPLRTHDKMGKVLYDAISVDSWIEEEKYSGRDLVTWDDQPSRSSNDPSTEPMSTPGSGSKRRKLGTTLVDKATSRSRSDRA